MSASALHPKEKKIDKSIVCDVRGPYNYDIIHNTNNWDTNFKCAVTVELLSMSFIEFHYFIRKSSLSSSSSAFGEASEYIYLCAAETWHTRRRKFYKQKFPIKKNIAGVSSWIKFQVYNYNRYITIQLMPFFAAKVLEACVIVWLRRRQ